jgi:hypothetical protein
VRDHTARAISAEPRQRSFRCTARGERVDPRGGTYWIPEPEFAGAAEAARAHPRSSTVMRSFLATLAPTVCSAMPSDSLRTRPQRPLRTRLSRHVEAPSVARLGTSGACRLRLSRLTRSSSHDSSAAEVRTFPRVVRVWHLNSARTPETYCPAPLGITGTFRVIVVPSAKVSCTLTNRTANGMSR